MDCHTARNILTDTIRRQKSVPAELQAAIDHCESCYTCQAGFSALTNAIQSSRTDDLPCAEVRESIYAYFLAGDGAARQFPAVRHHLKTCSFCANEYGLLVELLAQAAQEPLIRREAPAPQFDLSFLSDRPELWQEVGQRAKRLSQTVQIWLEAGQTVLADLPAQLFPPTPAMAWRDSNQPPARLTISDPDQHLQIHIGISPSADKLANLSVAVEPTGPDRSLPPLKVSLQDATRDLLERQQARAVNLVTFEQLAPGHYWLVIQMEEQTWEISIPVIAGEE